MFTQTVRPLKVATLLFALSGSFLSSEAHSQSYVPRIRHIDSVAAFTATDPANHLQASISQPEKGVMRFRVTVSNPGARKVFITLRRGNEELFSQIIRTDEYVNMYNLSEIEDGDYVLEINSGKEKIQKNISISTVTEINRQAAIN